ncbi:MAG: carboxypeptidase-like regulatory domain-containing protein [Bacteroidetes bacterium]|nr:carboxypeptidase-like regulatory domain-containing protein [Bacteroidota bacterium]
MTKFIFTYLFIFVATLSLSQSVTGKVVNDSNSEPLEFASIGVIGTNLGTLSNEKGLFNLNVSSQSPEARVRISMIGFEAQIILLENLINKETVIRLKEHSVQLNEVLVKSTKTKQKTIGTKTSSKHFLTGWGGYGAGERGILIKVAKPIYIEKVNFHIAYLEFDSVLFRLHIRKIENGSPTDELLNDNIYIKAKSTGWHEIDLNKYDLSFSQDIAVTIEWVKTWGKIKHPENWRNSLKLSMAFAKGILYGKEANEAQWTIYKRGSPGIYLTVQQ